MIRLNTFRLSFLLLLAWICPLSAQPITIELLPSKNPSSLLLRFPGLSLENPDHALFLATASGFDGSALVPFQKSTTGSSLFLPFQADHLLLLRGPTPTLSSRSWNGFGLAPFTNPPAEVKLLSNKTGPLELEIPRSWATPQGKLQIVAALKNIPAENGWGQLLRSSDPYLLPGPGDRSLTHFLSLSIETPSSPAALVPRAGGKIRIYQLFPRLFGNTNSARIPNGTLEQNGCGKFADLNDAALASLQQLGFDAIWVTGIYRQATTRDYSSLQLPPDDPDLLKGIAGSPYAIRDYYDVCPDYAVDPAKRLDEFKALLARAKNKNLRIFIDFVPNHVARSYASVVHPERDFGKDDQATEFFSGDDFYYLKPGSDGPPLHLSTFDTKKKQPTTPTTRVIWDDKDNRFPGLKEKIDGLFPPEQKRGRVTGDNQNTWRPSQDCWYETCKLNYGYDFTQGAKGKRKHPTALQPEVPVPNLWKKMDAIMNYWQEIGVDGFRCDVSHIIPSEFWHWALARARTRNPNTYFYAECYEGDTRLEVPDANPDLASYHSNPLSLIEAGFSSVYGHDVYKGLMKIYEESGWANDLDSLTRPGFVGDNSLRYAENHDECRIASTQHWGGHGMSVGRVVSTVLFALSRGPVMVYYGQEVGEAATVGAAGFELDKGRTTFFDYWSVPELQKWYHDGSCDGSPLSIDQKELRAFYGRALQSLTHPALAQGNFYPLNPANQSNPAYGRLSGETTSGHWMYSFLRNDPVNQKSVLVAVNLHPTQTLSGVRCLLSKESTAALALPTGATLTGTDLLASSNPTTFSAPADSLTTQGVPLPDLPPFSSYYFDLSTQK